jgi:hypothetical protein
MSIGTKETTFTTKFSTYRGSLFNKKPIQPGYELWTETMPETDMKKNELTKEHSEEPKSPKPHAGEHSQESTSQSSTQGQDSSNKNLQHNGRIMKTTSVKAPAYEHQNFDIWTQDYQVEADAAGYFDIFDNNCEEENARHLTRQARAGAYQFLYNAFKSANAKPHRGLILNPTRDPIIAWKKLWKFHKKRKGVQAEALHCQFDKLKLKEKGELPDRIQDYSDKLRLLQVQYNTSIDEEFDDKISEKTIRRRLLAEVQKLTGFDETLRHIKRTIANAHSTTFDYCYDEIMEEAHRIDSISDKRKPDKTLVATKPGCHNWARFNCGRGDDCRFSHEGKGGPAQEKYSSGRKPTSAPALCFNIRDYGICKREGCRFSHDKPTDATPAKKHPPPKAFEGLLWLL